MCRMISAFQKKKKKQSLRLRFQNQNFWAESAHLCWPMLFFMRFSPIITPRYFLEFSRGQFHFPRIILLLCWGLLKFSVVTVVSPFLVDTKILASLLLFPSYPLLPLKIPPSPKLSEKARSPKLSPPFVTRRGRARWAGKHWLFQMQTRSFTFPSALFLICSENSQPKWLGYNYVRI